MAGLRDRIAEGDSICFHHRKTCIDKFEFMQKACCDPFCSHTTAVKGSLRSINLELTEVLNVGCQKVIKPGQKLCPRTAKKNMQKRRSRLENVHFAQFGNDRRSHGSKMNLVLNESIFQAQFNAVQLIDFPPDTHDENVLQR